MRTHSCIHGDKLDNLLSSPTNLLSSSRITCSLNAEACVAACVFRCIRVLVLSRALPKRPWACDAAIITQVSTPTCGQVSPTIVIISE